MVKHVPASACIYERYDLETLAPLDLSGGKRLLGLGWAKEEFNGKTVLDIGCNSGFLSVTAAQLGARRVHSVDVNKELVAFLATVADRHKLPIVAEVCSFDKLDPAKTAADIVVFMEALQWIVAQGATIESAINKIALLTKSVLYIEFPWDGSDVFFERKAGVGEHFNAEYSSNKIFGSLSRFFRKVELQRFMRYFGYTHPKSNRLLVRCSGKRTEAAILVKLGRADSLDVSLGANEHNSRATLVDTPSGLKVIKRYTESAFLTRLDAKLREAIFREMSVAGRDLAVWPQLLENRYTTAADGQLFSVMPFVGDIAALAASRTGGSTGPAKCNRADLLNAAFAWSRAARQLSASLVLDLQHAKFFRPVNAQAWDSLREQPLRDAIQRGDLVDSLIRTGDSPADGRIRFLQHGDMHMSNIIKDSAGNARLIDFDLVCLGTCCMDLVFILIFANAAVPLVRSSIETLNGALSVNVTKFDIAYAVNMFLIWYRNATKMEPGVFRPLERYAPALNAVLGAYDVASDA